MQETMTQDSMSGLSVVPDDNPMSDSRESQKYRPVVDWIAAVALAMIAPISRRLSRIGGTPPLDH